MLEISPNESIGYHVLFLLGKIEYVKVSHPLEKSTLDKLSAIKGREFQEVDIRCGAKM